MNKNNAFIHGIIPGGLTTTNEIRVLVCWLASRQPEGVPQNLLIDSLTLEGLANYFEITAAISALLENGQVILEDDCVKLDGEGRRAAALLGDEIPPAVREKPPPPSTGWWTWPTKSRWPSTWSTRPPVNKDDHKTPSPPLPPRPSSSPQKPPCTSPQTPCRCWAATAS